MKTPTTQNRLYEEKMKLVGVLTNMNLIDIAGFIVDNKINTQKQTLAHLKEEIKKYFDEFEAFLDTEKQYDNGKIKVSSVITYLETARKEILKLLEDK